MNKNSIFLLCCGLAASATLGYIGGKGQNEATLQTTSQEKDSAARRIPRFGGVSSITGRPDKKSSGNRREGLDDLLRQYNKPSPQMIERELNNLHKANYARSVDVHQFFKLFYLSYKWGRQSPRQAFAFMESIRNSSVGELARTMVLQGWAESHPEDLTAYLKERKTGIERNPNILSQIAAEYGKASPDNAVQWFSTLDTEQKQSVLPALLSSITESHPDKIKTFLYLISFNQQKNDNLYPQIAEKWAVADWSAASAWIHTLPPADQDRAFKSALGALAKTDMDKATAEYLKLDDERKYFGAYGILPSIANQSPMKALDWLFQNVPEKDVPSLAHYALGYGGSLAPSEELTQRIINQPEGKTRDVLLESLLQKTTYSSDNYKKKLSLAAQITDEENRSRCVGNIVTQWSYSDPLAAKQWTESSTLPQEQKKKITDTCNTIMERNPALPKMREQK